MAERREREPKPLGDLLRTMVAGRGWSERMAVQRLREEWASVVGAHVAARSEPTRLQRGVLHVRADGGAWASELVLLTSVLKDKANEFLGPDSVRDVRIEAGLARAPTDPD